MNFIKGILGIVDDVWNLWTIPAYILFALFTISLFPIIGLLILLMLIGIKLQYISYCEQLTKKYSTKSNNKYEDNFNPETANRWKKKTRSTQFDILCAITVTVIITTVLISGNLESHYEMCVNQDIIPWSLTDILRMVTQPHC